MTKYRYTITCEECGEIDPDASGGLFDEATAHRRAGYHEGALGHDCDVEIAEKTNEYRCPVCHTKCVGERERDEHAQAEPGVKPDQFTRV